MIKYQEREHALHLHCLYNYWFCSDNGKEKLSASIFRTVQIQNEKDNLKSHVLKCIFWGSNFEVHPCSEMYFKFLTRLLLISLAFVKIYSDLCAPIFTFFLSVRTFHPCVLLWILKHQKYWYSFCWKHCDMNFITESWILSP